MKISPSALGDSRAHGKRATSGPVTSGGANADQKSSSSAGFQKLPATYYGGASQGCALVGPAGFMHLALGTQPAGRSHWRGRTTPCMSHEPRPSTRSFRGETSRRHPRPGSPAAGPPRRLAAGPSPAPALLCVALPTSPLPRAARSGPPARPLQVALVRGEARASALRC